MYYRILGSLDGVFVILSVLVLYGFVPPVIHLLIVAVMGGSSDARLRSFLVYSVIKKIDFCNLRINFYNKTILTSLDTNMTRVMDFHCLAV